MEKIIMINVLIWSLWLVNCGQRRRKYETLREYIERSGEAVGNDDLIHHYEKEHQKFYEEEIKNGIVSGQCRRKCETIRKFTKRTGAAVGNDILLHHYEKEHQRFYEEESKNGAYLEWPDLDNKNLTDFCRKYLQHEIPAKKSNDVATGFRFEKKLHYEKENTSITNSIIVVQCKVVQKKHQWTYYMTRAPEPNCVYSLKCIRSDGKFILSIIYKYCDFENKSLVNMALIQQRSKVVEMIHRQTGQPIAKDEYLLRYEIEHENLLKMEGDGGFLKWKHAMNHVNLNYYCYQYMKICVPSRRRDGVQGSWKFAKLCYKKLNTNKYINVTIVTCLLHISGRHYQMTRAHEENCVFALVRSAGINFLKIIFKHCDFEDPTYNEVISQDHNIPEKNVSPEAEVKEEIFDSMITMQLLPQH